jgi:hypothetical protein
MERVRVRALSRPSLWLFVPFPDLLFLPDLPCALGLVLTTSASTVSSASSILALLLIGSVVNLSPYLISPSPNLFLSYLTLLSYRLSIYSLDDGHTRDSKSKHTCTLFRA